MEIECFRCGKKLNSIQYCRECTDLLNMICITNIDNYSITGEYIETLTNLIDHLKQRDKERNILINMYHHKLSIIADLKKNQIIIKKIIHTNFRFNPQFDNLGAFLNIERFFSELGKYNTALTIELNHQPTKQLINVSIKKWWKFWWSVKQ